MSTTKIIRKTFYSFMSPIVEYIEELPKGVSGDTYDDLWKTGKAIIRHSTLGVLTFELGSVEWHNPITDEQKENFDV